MEKEIPEHRDRIGRLLKVGDCVAYPSHNSLEIGTIKKLNPKMIKVSRVGKMSKSEFNKYPADCVVLDGPDVVMYLLRQAT